MEHDPSISLSALIGIEPVTHLPRIFCFKINQTRGWLGKAYLLAVIKQQSTTILLAERALQPIEKIARFR